MRCVRRSQRGRLILGSQQPHHLSGGLIIGHSNPAHPAAPRQPLLRHCKRHGPKQRRQAGRQPSLIPRRCGVGQHDARAADTDIAAQRGASGPFAHPSIVATNRRPRCVLHVTGRR